MIMQRLLEDESFLKKPLSSPIETGKRSRRIRQKIYNHLNTAQMSANYKLVRNPNPNPEESGKSLPLHPRLVSCGTIHTDEGEPFPLLLMTHGDLLDEETYRSFVDFHHRHVVAR